MADEWRAASIEEVAEKVAMGPFGSSIKVETFVPSGVPVISGQHLHGFKVNESVEFNFVSCEHADRLKNANVQRGDIIFTHAGNIGQVAYVPEDSKFERYVISQRQFYLRCDRSEVMPEFVVAYFKTPEGQHKLLANASQVGVPSIAQPVTYLRTIEIPVPPLSEQRAITHILCALDDKIELNKRMNETLETVARSIFKSWFVDFDPVRAKAQSRDPGLPKEIVDLFPDSFEDSELGEIPAGWNVGTIGSVADVIDCLHSKKPERRDTGLPLLQLSNIRDNGLIDMQDTYFIDEADYRKWISRIEASPGDCVITNVGRVGAVAQMPVGQKAALGRNMTGVRCKSGFPYPTWLIECLLSQAMKDEIILKMDTGTILDALNVRNIPILRFIRGDREILRHFEQQARPLRAQMETHFAESRTLAALRDALLPKLISGELRVKDNGQCIRKA